jgi:hypothetical protein
MTDRGSKERKLIAFIVNDLRLNLEEPEMTEVAEEVRTLPEEELDRTLAGRLDLALPGRRGDAQVGP